MTMTSCHIPRPGEDDCWKGDLARLSTPGHQLCLVPITHPCLIHGNPQSPFVCGQSEPGQLEGPGLVLFSELAERSAPTDEAEARKNRSRRKNNLPPKKPPVLWKSSITFDDRSCNTTGLSLFIVFQDKRSFCSASTEPFLNHLEMESSFESPRNKFSWQLAATRNEEQALWPRPPKGIQVPHEGRESEADFTEDCIRRWRTG